MSFNYGAKEYGRVKQTIRYTAVILLVLYIICVGNDNVISEPVCDDL